jgi:hypothetical protein
VSKKRDRVHSAVGDFLAAHPGVTHQKLGNGDFRYRYGHLTCTWYHTGTVLVQGVGVGNLVFKHLNCPTCQGQPKIIQALNWMVRQADKKVRLGDVVDHAGRVGRLNEVLKRAGSKERTEYHRDLDKRIRERRKKLES